MSLASTLALLRPALPSYVHLTRHGLIRCQRDNFQLNPKPKAPALAREMARTMFALGASSVIEGYTMSRMLPAGGDLRGEVPGAGQAVAPPPLAALRPGRPHEGEGPDRAGGHRPAVGAHAVHFCRGSRPVPAGGGGDGSERHGRLDGHSALAPWALPLAAVWPWPVGAAADRHSFGTGERAHDGDGPLMCRSLVDGDQRRSNAFVAVAKAEC